MRETLSVLSFEMSHPNTTEEFIIPLHHTLSHQKNHPSFPSAIKTKTMPHHHRFNKFNQERELATFIQSIQ
jgi:hypothetical protein